MCRCVTAVIDSAARELKGRSVLQLRCSSTATRHEATGWNWVEGKFVPCCHNLRRILQGGLTHERLNPTALRDSWQQVFVICICPFFIETVSSCFLCIQSFWISSPVSHLDCSQLCSPALLVQIVLVSLCVSQVIFIVIVSSSLNSLDGFRSVSGFFWFSSTCAALPCFGFCYFWKVQRKTSRSEEESLLTSLVAEKTKKKRSG